MVLGIGILCFGLGSWFGMILMAIMYYTDDK